MTSSTLIVENKDYKHTIPSPISLGSNGNHPAFYLSSLTIEAAYHDTIPADSLINGPNSHFSRFIYATGAHMRTSSFMYSCFKNPNSVGIRNINLDKESCSALWNIKY